MLNLFTLLVFLLVFTAVYAVRALGKRQRQHDAIEARLALLRAEWDLPGQNVLDGADSIARPVDGDSHFAWWPWLAAHWQSWQTGVELIGWKKTLRQRLVLSGAVALVLGMLIGRMTPMPGTVTLLGGAVFFVIIIAINYQSAKAKYLAALGRCLPEVIDAITRICRAGVPVHSAFAIAADNLQCALSPELHHIDHWLKLGLPLRQVIQESAQRVPLAEYRFFAVILIIAQESGGRLGDTLERLATTLRARSELQMKVMAKTSEARASTKIVALLVPGVLGYMYLNAPADFRFMFSDASGLKVSLYAAVSVGLGLLITHVMVRRIR